MSKPSNLLRVYLFNVGAGDHLLIEFPDDSIGIIDFHKSGKLNWHQSPAYYYLKYKINTEKKAFKVSFICFSHYDLDHIRGATAILKLLKDYDIVVEDVWMAGAEDRGGILRLFKNKVEDYKNRMPPEVQSSRIAELETVWNDYHSSFEEIMAILEYELNIQMPKTASAFKSIRGNLGNQSIEAYSIAPLEKHIKQYKTMDAEEFVHAFIFNDRGHIQADRNLISSIIYLNHKKFRLAFGGDASAEVWKDCLREIDRSELQEKYPVDSDFIKVSHHGSKKSSHPEIWERLIGKKEKVFFGISAGLKYGHPHEQTLSEIKTACAACGIMKQVFATNRCVGCIEGMEIPEQDCDNWTADLQKGSRHIRENPSSRMSLRMMYSDSYKTQTKYSDSKSLAAYIFEFNLDSGESKVYKGMSSYLHTIKEECAGDCKFA